MNFGTRNRLLASSLIAGTMATAFPAMAQDSTTVAPEAGTVDETIVVTGSRIRRDLFQTVEPEISVSEQIVKQRGYTNVADALNEVPSFGLAGSSTAGSEQGQNNVGANFVNFFGLGSQRTLTVVNGRRFVAANSPSVFNQGAPGLQVDLNVIPTGLIDRVETIAVGGAPIYGSDAIAGTVNIILKRDFDGVELTASNGISQRGDMGEYRIAGLIGTNFAEGRGNVVLSVEHNKRDGIIQTQRDRFAPSLSFQTNPLNGGPADGIPDRVLITNPRVTFATFGGLPSLGFGNPFNFGGLPISGNGSPVLQFGPSGTLVPFDPGVQYGAVFSSGGDGINLSDLSNLYTPLERTLVNALGRFEVATGVEVYTELFYARTRANDQVSQAVWNTDFFGGDSAALVFNVNNPFLSPADAAIIQANCDAATIAPCDFFLSRNGLSITSGKNETTQDLYRIVAGARGDFNVAGRKWSYDVSFNYGQSDASSYYQGISNRRLGFALDAVALTPAAIGGMASGSTLNVVRNGSVVMGVTQPNLQAGDIACAVGVTPPAPGDDRLAGDVRGCVPLNYFGSGTTSAQAREYVNIPFTADSRIKQRIFEAYVTGDLFNTWAGPVSAAFGYQNRLEEASFTPGSAYLLGLGRSTAGEPTGGDFQTNEFYGELRVPLISNEMGLFISSATAEGKARFVNNNRAGKDWTYTVGGRIGFADDMVSVRGNFTRSIRSPALVEVFLPTTTTFTTANDPCDVSNISAGANAANRQANCTAHALALGYADLATFQSVVINGTAQGTTGGNANLNNEIADSWTIGAIFQPKFLRGLSIAADYINIKVSGAISDLDLTSVMRACYDAPTFGNEYCSRFTRAPGSDPAAPFQVQDGFSTGYANAGFLNFQGLQAQVNYAMDVADTFGGQGDLGKLSISGSLFHLLERQESVTGFDLSDTRGTIGNSNWRGQLNLAYERGPIGLFWQTRYIGPAKFSNDDTAESRDVLSIGSYWLFNAGVTVRPTEVMEFQLNVDNVFDVAQPYAAGASANFFVYDQIGRFFRATGRLRF